MTTVTLSKPFSEIHAEATEAASAAAANLLNTMYGGKDNYPCGFAWVIVEGVKLSTKVGKEFAKEGFSKSYYKGIEIWNPSKSNVQNMDVKYAGACAYASVLKKYGIKAYAQERLD